MFVHMCTYAQLPEREYIVDSGASVSGVSDISQLNNPQTCHVPITPAFGKVMHAQARGTINDPLIGHLGIPALHLPAMNQNLVSVFGFWSGGVPGSNKWAYSQLKDADFTLFKPTRMF